MTDDDAYWMSETPRLLLGWLLCYPAQPALHLAVALQPGRAQLDVSGVLRHLNHLAALGLVEAFASASLPGRVWSLTAAGMQLLARSLQTQQTMQTDEQQGLAARWQVDQQAVQRLLPRLAHTTALERLLLGLGVYAPDGFAPLSTPRVGARPAVAWHWLNGASGWQHRFEYHGQLVTAHADAVMLWRRMQPGHASGAITLVPPLAQVAPPSSSPGSASAAGEGEDASGATAAMAHTGPPAQTQTQATTWHAAFVLVEGELDDRERVRHCLECLLHYRESAERWAVYQSFPPVLLVLKYAQHAGLWREEMHRAAERTRTTPLVGAITLLPGPGLTHVSSPSNTPGLPDLWRSAWQQLADGSPVYLRDVLAQPTPPRGWPEGVRDHLQATFGVLHTLAQARLATPSVAVPPRSSPSRASRALAAQRHPPPTARAWHARLAALSMGLGARHVMLLTLLARYPGLSTGELAALVGIEVVSATRYLSDLARQACVERWHPVFGSKSADTEVAPLSPAGELTSGDARWLLSECGLRFVAATHALPLQHLGAYQKAVAPLPLPAAIPLAHPSPPSRDATDGGANRGEAGDAHAGKATLVLRGWEQRARHAAHLCGIYGVIAAFHRAAPPARLRLRRLPDRHPQQAALACVTWWEMGAACERSYPWRGIRRNLRPDAELALTTPMQQPQQQQARQTYQPEQPSRVLRCWLEYDRGTMGARDLAAKMRAYAAYVRSKEWVKDGLSALPRLLFVVPDGEQERRVTQACALCLAGLPLRVLVTTAGHLAAYGPLAGIWRQAHPATNTTGDGSAVQVQASRHTVWA